MANDKNNKEMTITAELKGITQIKLQIAKLNASLKEMLGKKDFSVIVGIDKAKFDRDLFDISGSIDNLIKQKNTVNINAKLSGVQEIKDKLSNLKLEVKLTPTIDIGRHKDLQSVIDKHFKDIRVDLNVVADINKKALEKGLGLSRDKIQVFDKDNGGAMKEIEDTVAKVPVKFQFASTSDSEFLGDIEKRLKNIQQLAKSISLNFGISEDLKVLASAIPKKTKKKDDATADVAELPASRKLDLGINYTSNISSAQLEEMTKKLNKFAKIATDNPDGINIKLNIDMPKLDNIEDITNFLKVVGKGAKSKEIKIAPSKEIADLATGGTNVPSSVSNVNAPEVKVDNTEATHKKKARAEEKAKVEVRKNLSDADEFPELAKLFDKTQKGKKFVNIDRALEDVTGMSLRDQSGMAKQVTLEAMANILGKKGMDEYIKDADSDIGKLYNSLREHAVARLSEESAMYRFESRDTGEAISLDNMPHSARIKALKSDAYAVFDAPPDADISKITARNDEERAKVAEDLDKKIKSIDKFFDNNGKRSPISKSEITAERKALAKEYFAMGDSKYDENGRLTEEAKSLQAEIKRLDYLKNNFNSSDEAYLNTLYEYLRNKKDQYKVLAEHLNETDRAARESLPVSEMQYMYGRGVANGDVDYKRVVSTLKGSIARKSLNGDYEGASQDKKVLNDFLAQVEDPYNNKVKDILSNYGNKKGYNKSALIDTLDKRRKSQDTILGLDSTDEAEISYLEKLSKVTSNSSAKKVILSRIVELRQNIINSANKDADELIKYYQDIFNELKEKIISKSRAHKDISADVQDLVATSDSLLRQQQKIGTPNYMQQFRALNDLRGFISTENNKDGKSGSALDLLSATADNYKLKNDFMNGKTQNAKQQMWAKLNEIPSLIDKLSTASANDVDVLKQQLSDTITEVQKIGLSGGGLRDASLISMLEGYKDAYLGANGISHADAKNNTGINALYEQIDILRKNIGQETSASTSEEVANARKQQQGAIHNLLTYDPNIGNSEDLVSAYKGAVDKLMMAKLGDTGRTGASGLASGTFELVNKLKDQSVLDVDALKDLEAYGKELLEVGKACRALETDFNRLKHERDKLFEDKKSGRISEESFSDNLITNYSEEIQAKKDTGKLVNYNSYINQYKQLANESQSDEVKSKYISEANRLKQEYEEIQKLGEKPLADSDEKIREIIKRLNERALTYKEAKSAVEKYIQARRASGLFGIEDDKDLFNGMSNSSNDPNKLGDVLVRDMLSSFDSKDKSYFEGLQKQSFGKSIEAYRSATEDKIRAGFGNYKSEASALERNLASIQDEDTQKAFGKYIEDLKAQAEKLEKVYNEQARIKAKIEDVQNQIVDKLKEFDEAFKTGGDVEAKSAELDELAKELNELNLSNGGSQQDTLRMLQNTVMRSGLSHESEAVRAFSENNITRLHNEQRALRDVMRGVNRDLSQEEENIDEVGQQIAELEEKLEGVSEKLKTSNDPKDVKELEKEYKKLLRLLYDLQIQSGRLSFNQASTRLLNRAGAYSHDSVQRRSLLDLSNEYRRRNEENKRDRQGTFGSIVDSLSYTIKAFGRATKGTGSAFEASAMGLKDSYNQFMTSSTWVGKSLGIMGAGLAGAGLALASLRGVITGAIQGIEIFGGMLQKVADVIWKVLEPGIELYRTKEASKYSLGAAIYNQGMVDEKRLNSYGPTGLNLGKSASSKIIKRAEFDAERSIFSFNDILESLSGTLPMLMSKGMSVSQAYDINMGVASVARMLNLKDNQVLQETRDLAQGSITARTSQVANALGITNAQLKDKTSDEIYKFLTDKFAAYSEVLREFAETPIGTFEQMKDRFSLVSEKIVEALIEPFKGVFTWLTDFTGTWKDKSGREYSRVEYDKTTGDTAQVWKEYVKDPEGNFARDINGDRVERGSNINKIAEVFSTDVKTLAEELKKIAEGNLAVKDSNYSTALDMMDVSSSADATEALKKYFGMTDDAFLELSPEIESIKDSIAEIVDYFMQSVDSMVGYIRELFGLTDETDTGTEVIKTIIDLTFMLINILAITVYYLKDWLVRGERIVVCLANIVRITLLAVRSLTDLGIAIWDFFSYLWETAKYLTGFSDKGSWEKSASSHISSVEAFGENFIDWTNTKAWESYDDVAKSLKPTSSKEITSILEAYNNLKNKLSAREKNADVLAKDRRSNPDNIKGTKTDDENDKKKEKEAIKESQKALKEHIEALKEALADHVDKLKELAEKNDISFKEGFTSIKEYYEQKAELDRQEAEARLQEAKEELEAIKNSKFENEYDQLKEMHKVQREINKYTRALGRAETAQREIAKDTQEFTNTTKQVMSTFTNGLNDTIDLVYGMMGSFATASNANSSGGSYAKTGNEFTDVASMVASIVGLDPKVVWAQMAHEVGGTDYQSDHNYSGIKYVGQEGAKQGNLSPEGDYYAVYESAEAYAKDYARILKRAAEAMKGAGTDAYKIAQSLKNIGYYTDTVDNYASGLGRWLNQAPTFNAVANNGSFVNSKGTNSIINAIDYALDNGLRNAEMPHLQLGCVEAVVRLGSYFNTLLAKEVEKGTAGVSSLVDNLVAQGVVNDKDVTTLNPGDILVCNNGGHVVMVKDGEHYVGNSSYNNGNTSSGSGILEGDLSYWWKRADSVLRTGTQGVDKSFAMNLLSPHSTKLSSEAYDAYQQAIERIQDLQSEIDGEIFGRLPHYEVVLRSLYKELNKLRRVTKPDEQVVSTITLLTKRIAQREQVLLTDTLTKQLDFNLNQLEHTSKILENKFAYSNASEFWHLDFADILNRYVDYIANPIDVKSLKAKLATVSGGLGGISTLDRYQSLNDTLWKAQNIETNKPIWDKNVEFKNSIKALSDSKNLDELAKVQADYNKWLKEGVNASIVNSIEAIEKEYNSVKKDLLDNNVDLNLLKDTNSAYKRWKKANDELWEMMNVEGKKGTEAQIAEKTKETKDLLEDYNSKNNKLDESKKNLKSNLASLNHRLMLAVQTPANQLKELEKQFIYYTNEGMLTKASEIRDKILSARSKLFTMVDSWLSAIEKSFDHMGEYLDTFPLTTLQSEKGHEELKMYKNQAIYEATGAELERGKADYNALYAQTQEMINRTNQLTEAQKSLNSSSEEYAKIQNELNDLTPQIALNVEKLEQDYARLNETSRKHDMADRLRQELPYIKQVGQAFDQAFENSFMEFLTTGMDGTKTLRQAFADMLRSMLQEMQKFFAKRVVQTFMTTLFKPHNDEGKKFTTDNLNKPVQGVQSPDTLGVSGTVPSVTSGNASEQALRTSMQTLTMSIDRLTSSIDAFNVRENGAIKKNVDAINKETKSRIEAVDTESQGELKESMASAMSSEGDREEAKSSLEAANADKQEAKTSTSNTNTVNSYGAMGMMGGSTFSFTPIGQSSSGAGAWLGNALGTVLDYPVRIITSVFDQITGFLNSPVFTKLFSSVEGMIGSAGAQLAGTVTAIGAIINGDTKERLLGMIFLEVQLVYSTVQQILSILSMFLQESMGAFVGTSDIDDTVDDATVDAANATVNASNLSGAKSSGTVSAGGGANGASEASSEATSSSSGASSKNFINNAFGHEIVQTLGSAFAAFTLFTGDTKERLLSMIYLQLQLIHSAIVGLSTPAYATGGYVSGAGTGTSDSIPARLSNGEYVVKASAVKKYGTNFLNAVNSGTFTRIRPTVAKFADGGLVETTARDTTSEAIGALGKNIGMNVNNTAHFNLVLASNQEEAMRAYMKSPEGQRIYLDMARKYNSVTTKF